MKSKNLLGLDQAEMMEAMISLQEKPFRGRQLYHQIYARKQYDFARMTDLSKSFRARLAQQFSIELPEIVQRFPAADGSVKFLFRLEDGRFIEAVLIPEKKRQTLCISSQAGCGVGCTFCQTARMGLQRNLNPGEIVGQVLQIIREGPLRPRGFNVVFMGMGEPLHNYRNVMKAFRILTDQSGMNLSHRKITISTSGIVPVIEKMAQEILLPNLAISLNATTDELRDRIMPVNKKWNIASLLRACRSLPFDSRRRITIEYVLLKGENDSDEDARRLAGLLKDLPVKVNLIPYNPNPGLPHRRPDPERVEGFLKRLSELQRTVFVRKTRGDDISAACGQLAYLEDRPELQLESWS